MNYKYIYLVICFITSLSLWSNDTNPKLDSIINLKLDSIIEIRKIDELHASKISKVLVLDNEGRIKPLHTLSSELLRKISRKDKLYNQNATQIIIGMRIDPWLWRRIPLIKVSDPSVLKIINQDGPLISFNSFIDGDKYILQSYLETANNKRPIDRSKFDNNILDINERVSICNMIFNENLIDPEYSFFKIFPTKNTFYDNAGDTVESYTWFSDVSMSIPGIDSAKTHSFKAVYRMLVDEALKGGTSSHWNDANGLVKFIDVEQQNYSDILPSEFKINAEIFYNNLKPFGWSRLFAFYLILGVVLLYFLLLRIFFPKNTIGKFFNLIVKSLNIVIFLGFLFHLGALCLRWFISGHAPWSDAYESVIFIAFATMLAGIVFSRKSSFALAASCLVAAMLLFVANLNWLNPELTNLVPVLKSYWLMIHVSVITSSYGFFGLSAFLGFLSLVLIIISHNNRIKSNISELTVINEQSMIIGLFLLTVGTFLGGVWANESWGRYWGWDPKETWALVSIMVYSLILHLRLLKTQYYVYLFNLFALFGFSSILMTYFGVNYYLDGLHSYAAGDSFPVPTFVPWTVLILTILSIISFLRFFFNLDKK